MKTTMYDKVILVMKHNLTFYPPVISVCHALRTLGKEVVYIGANSDTNVQKALEAIGVRFFVQPEYGGSAPKRLLQQIIFKKNVEPLIEKEYGANTCIWFVHLETVVLFIHYFKTHHCIAHLLEFRMRKISWGYRLLSGFRDRIDLLKKASKVICCEYNRAHLTQAVLSLPELPLIFPNKPYLQNNEAISVGDLPSELNNVIEKIRNKKVIIYQGGFMRERKLDAFYKAMDYLPDDYVFVAMGADSAEKQRLMNTYKNERCIFLPFIRPPYHLEITRMAHIGILSYIPLGENLGQMINVLYCAPNKIFEYGKFGLPMLSNDLPSLKLQFAEIKCGITLESMTPECICHAIESIDENYDEYSLNAKKLYESVDVVGIVKQAIEYEIADI